MLILKNTYKVQVNKQTNSNIRFNNILLEIVK